MDNEPKFTPNLSQKIVQLVAEESDKVGFAMTRETPLDTPHDRVDIALRIERELGLAGRLPNHIALNWKTVGDVIDTVMGLMGE